MNLKRFILPLAIASIATGFLIAKVEGKDPAAGFMLPTTHACADTDSLTEVVMGEPHFEDILLGAVSLQSTYVVVYVNKKTGTWTIVEVHRTGYSCILAVGDFIADDKGNTYPPEKKPLSGKGGK